MTQLASCFCESMGTWVWIQQWSKRLAVKIFLCNPSDRNLETGGSLGYLADLTSRLVSCRFIERPCLKNQRGKKLRKTPDVHLWPLHVYFQLQAQVHTHTHTHTVLQGIDKIKHQFWYLRLTLSDHGKITFANTPHLDTPHLWLRLTSAVTKSNVPNDVIQDFLIPGYLCCPDIKLSEESSLRSATLKIPGNHICFIKCQCVQILSRKFCSPPILKAAAAPLSDAFYFSGEASLAAWNDYSSRKSHAGTKHRKMPLKCWPLLWFCVRPATAPMLEHTKLCVQGQTQGRQRWLSG